jgi:hypothetical protein
MAASNSVIDVSGWLDDRLAGASPDLLRAMVKQFAEALMSAEAEADAARGAGNRKRSEQWMNSRNGYRLRDWNTRVGSVELAIPKLRSIGVGRARPRSSLPLPRHCSPLRRCRTPETCARTCWRAGGRTCTKKAAVPRYSPP